MITNIDKFKESLGGEYSENKFIEITINKSYDLLRAITELQKAIEYTQNNVSSFYVDETFVDELGEMYSKVGAFNDMLKYEDYDETSSTGETTSTGESTTDETETDM